MSKAKQSKKLKCVGWAVVRITKKGRRALVTSVGDTRRDVISWFNLDWVVKYKKQNRRFYRAQRVYVEEWE